LITVLQKYESGDGVFCVLLTNQNYTAAFVLFKLINGKLIII